MAVTNPANQDGPASAPPRVMIGANVILTIAMAVAFVVAVNWFASMKHIRRDASTFGGYGLSDRTKNILTGVKGSVTVSTAYLSTEPGKNKDKYFGAVASYCDDLHLANDSVAIRHIARDEDKLKLVEALKKQYGSESGEHEKVIADYKKLKSDLAATLKFGDALRAEGSDKDSWLAYFAFFTQMVREFADERKTLEQTDEDVGKLINTGLPKYSEATNKISGALKPLKDTLGREQKNLSLVAGLADAVKKADSGIVKSLRDIAAGAPALLEPIVASLGAADAKAALSAFAAAAQEADTQIKAAARKIDDVARENPAITAHPFWQLSVKMDLGGMPIASGIDASKILEQAGSNLRSARQVALDIVDRKDDAKIADTVKQIRERLIPNMQQNVGAVKQTLERLAGALANIDAESARLLETARGGTAFQNAIKAIDELTARIDKLPELKLGKIGDELKGDNIVVVEANGQAKVVNFDTVWPLRDSQNMSMDTEDRPRTFNGDAAIGGAILALTSDKPFATVVFATFEVEPPQQMRQMMQPQNSSIPGQTLTQIKERLKSANFSVKDWDLSKPGPAPEPEKDTQSLFIFLPPAPANPPNPFMQGQDMSRKFGDAEMKRVQEVLDKGAPALFLAGWEVRRGGMFGGVTTPEYGYGKMLKEQYGIDVDTAHRVVWVDPDPRTPEKFGVTGEKFQYMTLNNFASQPIVEPFKHSRIVVLNSCPVVRADKTPDGVTIEPLISIPQSEDYVLTDPNEVMRMVQVIRDPESGGKIDRKPSLREPPYPVAVAATKKKADKETRIVVMGTGQSLMDEYLTQPIMRMNAKGNLYADAPPTGNADLVANALHWLRGQDKWIAAGPVSAPVIQAIQPPTKMMIIRLVLCIGLPLGAICFGLMMWMSRRQ